MRLVAVLAPILSLTLWGCGDDSDSSPIDAESLPLDGIPIYDAGPPRDGSDPLTWVDFTITGCGAGSDQSQGPSGDAGVGPVDAAAVAVDAGNGDAGVADPCVGEAPLTLRFTALSDGVIEIHNWSFGDNSGADMSASPEHTFTAPGSYTVSLNVGGPGGTATVTKVGAVLVRAARLGSACSADAQCASSECVCDDATTCVAGLQSGLCAADCSMASPCSEGVCAKLNPAGVGSPEDWQRSLCLPPCNGDGDCRAGLVCRELERGDADGWIKGCFVPGVLGDIGDACVDSNGTPTNSACTTGTCLGEGARAMCSETCTTGTCPGSAACATFVGSLGSWCLARCGPGQLCDTDPWLTCEAPGGSGSKDFTVDETAATPGYCAPKSCSGAGECGTEGQCTDGFCAP